MNSKQLAWKIRRHALEMTHISKGSHIGSVLSVADIIAVLYTDVLHFDPKNPNWESRDRLILSKGHAGAALYAALAEKGFFETEYLKTHYANGSKLSGHVSHHIPGVDLSTGSLGHGLSVGVGMAYAAKKDNLKHSVYVVLGDGECDEGSVWEAALFANHFRLNNLVAIIDHNNMQSMDFCENTLELENFGDKWRAFGWNVAEIDGNNHEQLKEAFKKAADNSDGTHRPTVIIAKTIKGYGVDFMQNDILWHYRFPHDGWEYDTAVTCLHKNMPEGVTDPYTPNGIVSPKMPDESSDIGNDHTFSADWNSSYPEKMRRVTAKSGSYDEIKKVQE